MWSGNCKPLYLLLEKVLGHQEKPARQPLWLFLSASLRLVASIQQAETTQVREQGGPKQGFPYFPPLAPPPRLLPLALMFP